MQADSSGTDDPLGSPPGTASTYSTAGGGTVFEHRVGAVYLSALLAEESAPGVRPSYVVTEVAFQQKGQGNHLDDLVVTAASPEGRTQSIEFAIRHVPQWIPSAPKFIDLMDALLRAEEELREALARDEHRLGIIHVAGDRSSDQVRQLSDLARNSTDPDNFLELLAGRSAALRDRYHHVVNTARQLATSDVDHRVYRVLRSLYVVPMAVEGDPCGDLTEAQNRARRVSVDETEAAATTTFSALLGIAQETATHGGTSNWASLRRRVGLLVSLKRSRQAASARQRLEATSRMAEAAVNETLAGRFTIDRSGIAEQVGDAAARGPVVMLGDPGGGKSAVARQVLRAHRDSGGYAVFLDLRELGSARELMQFVGEPLTDVLADAVAPIPPLLVIDRCESVLEDRVNTLRLLLTGALGWSVLVVGRWEGASRTLEIVSAELGSEPQQIPLGAFSQAEMGQVLTEFPELRPLMRQGRTAALLARPYLLDLVLRDAVRSRLPSRPLAEVDVMQAVWAGLVRRNEEITPGSSPDGREQNLLELARAHLADPSTQPHLPDLGSLAGLRSDGLLRARDVPGISRPEDFGHDVIRDFAVAQLMLGTGSAHEIMRLQGAPRWALHAARLYCQATLRPDMNTVAARFAVLNEEFAAIAEEHGRRWVDIPIEALLTIDDPGAALEGVLPALIGPEGPSVQDVLAVTRRRFTSRQGEQPQLSTWIPVLGTLLDHLDEIDESIHVVVVEWICELLLAAAVLEYANTRSVVELLGGPVVNQLETYLLSHLGNRREDEATLQALTLLAGNFSPAAHQHLHSLAVEDPDKLKAVVDGQIGAELLARHQPDLLLELTDAYYIRRRRTRAAAKSRPAFLEFDDGFDDFHYGVRDHSHGVGFPFAGPDFGPFSALLKVRPDQTIALIKRLVDHASASRSRRLSSLDSGDRLSTSIDVGGGARDFVGDDHVYAWYRGLGVGPYPAMSALLALERHLDRRIADGEALPDLAAVVLNDASSLAFLGLWVGLLVRHLPQVTDELDPFVSQAAIWHLEAMRVTREHGDFRAQREDQAAQPQERLWTFSQVAGYLALTTDPGRQIALTEVRRRLREHHDVQPAVLENWAGQLDPGAYRIGRSGEQIVVEYQPAPEIEAALEPSRVQQEVARLIHRCMYVHSGYCRGETELNGAAVLSDLAALEALTETDVQAHGRYVFDAIAAAASAIVLAAQRGEIQPDSPQLKSAKDNVLELAELSGAFDEGPGAVRGEVFPMGFDRSIARAAPVLLLDADRAAAAEAALIRLAQSPYEEVQHALAVGLEVAWSAPCSGTGDACLHRAAYRIVEEMVRWVGMGPWSDQGFRSRQRLEGHLPQGLTELPARDVYMHSCTGPVLALDACARSSACTSGDADTLELALIDKVAMAWVDWAGREGYVDISDAQGIHAVVAARALDGDERSLRILESAYRGQGALTASLLLAMAASATHPGRQHRLAVLWPEIMHSAVSGIERGDIKDRYGRRDLLGALLPIHPDGLEIAAWPLPSDIQSQVERVIAMNRVSSEFTTALADYLMQQSVQDQISYGLQWILAIVANRAERLARRTRVPSWLESLRLGAGTQLRGEALSSWFRIVDLLAAHGDQRCVRLQLLEE